MSTFVQPDGSYQQRLQQRLAPASACLGALAEGVLAGDPIQPTGARTLV